MPCLLRTHALYLSPTTSLCPPSSKFPAFSITRKPNQNAHLRFSSPRPIRFSLAVADSSSPPATGAVQVRPSPAELSRTIMELSSTGTLSTVTHDGWPLGIGARFVVDEKGVPALCLDLPEDEGFSVGKRSSFHVQLEQGGSRTPHCTVLGILGKPEDGLLVKKLHTNWEKRFGEKVESNHLYSLSVEKVLHMENFKESGIWVTPSEYSNADPDPLRNIAEEIVDEMNAKHAEDVHRLCSIYVDTEFQVTDAKMIWVDRLGFDLHIYSEGNILEARIPFPREVSDEKGVKSSFNCMTHLAWEVEKNYVTAEFQKVKFLKRIT